MYIIKLYDTPMITFSLEPKGIEGLQAEIISVNEEKKHLMPKDLELSNKGLLKWLQRRIIPKNRTFVHEILKTLGLQVNDTKGIIDVCKGLSLNDSFWIVPSDFQGKFSEYNLYENKFSEMLSLVAYTGIGTSNKAFTTSPELTTQGMLKKAWRYMKNNGIYLYKGGTTGACNTGNEPYSEYYACQIAKAMGLKAVEYDLANWKGTLCSTCKLFTSKDISFISIGRIIKDVSLKACLDYYKNLGDEFYNQLCSMLVFDSIIYNEDRHFGNFGLLIDNTTGDIIAPAPIFDNGFSLYNFAMENDFKDLKEYSKMRSNPYNVSFEDVCKEVINAEQMVQLKKLIGFKFTRHDKLNLSETKLTAIENHIQVRIRELMKLRDRKLEIQPKKSVLEQLRETKPSEHKPKENKRQDFER